MTNIPDIKPALNMAPGRDNRLTVVLDAAASCFCARGYDAASMRHIALRAGMKAGSLYYHFPSKSELLVAVHEEGIRRITARVQVSVEQINGPRHRLQAAMVAHMEALLDGGDYAQVVIRELPEMESEQRHRLVSLRDQYENVFRDLIAQLPIGSERRKRHLRLLVLGALNWSRTWYRPGEESPSDIAMGFLELIDLT